MSSPLNVMFEIAREPLVVFDATKDICQKLSVCRVNVVVPVCRSGNGVGRINEVSLRRARLVLGWVTRLRADISPRYVTSHPGQLSLAIPPWVGALSTSDGFCHR